jgi:HK97 family phage prohead protease
MSIETKQFGGNILEVKQEDRNGVPVGIIKGYIATWDLDRGDGWMRDKFAKGAFKKSIARHKKEKRQIRFKDHHGRTVGGFPIESVKEDDIGLYGEAEVNLDVQQGREAYSLAKQGVLVEFSVGFSAIESERDHKKNIREITVAEIWEGSIVDEPMNPKAKVTEVKTMSNLLEVVDSEFDQSEAKARVENLSDNSQAYIGGFLVADVIGGELKAIVQAINIAAGEVKKLPEQERNGYIIELDKYYAKMNIKSPFCKDAIIDAEAARNIQPRELENTLIATGMFSQKAAKIIASSMKPEKKDPDFSEIMSGLKNLKAKLS